MPVNVTAENQTSADALNQQLTQDPEMQALVAETQRRLKMGHGPGMATDYFARSLAPILQKHGFTGQTLPNGFHVGTSGQVEPDKTFWEKYGTAILMNAAVVGGAFAAPAIVGALSSGGGATVAGGAAASSGGTAAGAAVPAALPAALPVSAGLPAGLAPTLGTTAASGFGAGSAGVPFASGAVFTGSAVPPAAMPAGAPAALPPMMPAARGLPDSLRQGMKPLPPAPPPPPAKPASPWTDMAKKLAGTAINKFTGDRMVNATEDASNKALAQQKASMDQAFDIEQQLHDETRADFGPYSQVGGSAMTTLGALMGLPAGGGGAALNAPLNLRSGSNSASAPVTTPPPPTTPTAPAQPTAPPPNPNLRPVPGLPSPVREQTQSSVAPDAGGMVMLQAPDGARRSVPKSQVNYWQKKGAQVVG